MINWYGVSTIFFSSGGCCFVIFEIEVCEEVVRTFGNNLGSNFTTGCFYHMLSWEDLFIWSKKIYAPSFDRTVRFP
jgi:hypothetical protein